MNKPTCKDCTINHGTVCDKHRGGSLRLGAGGVLLMLSALFAAFTFLATERELEAVRDAVIVPFLLITGAFLLPVGLVYLICALSARQVRLK